MNYSEINNLILNQKYFIVGWDTEFNAQRNELYSHQFYFLWQDNEHKFFWEIEDKAKITWEGLIKFLSQKIIEATNIKNLENYELILLAHYGSAEIGTIQDFNNVLFQDQTVLISYGKYATYKELLNSQFKKVRILDTMNIEKTSLWDIGESLGIPKINFKEEIFKALPELKAAEAQPIEMFGELLQNEKTRPICIDYGLRDAEICLKFYLSIVNRIYKLTGKIFLKETLPSYSETLFIEEGKKTFGGKKELMAKLGYYPVVDKTKPRINNKYQYTWEIHPDFTHYGTLAFSGGRNQTYFSGIIKIPTADYDLIGAYSIGLRLIKTLKIKKIGNAIANIQYDYYNLKDFLRLISTMNFEEYITLQGVIQGTITLKDDIPIAPMMSEINGSLAEIGVFDGTAHILEFVIFLKFYPEKINWSKTNIKGIFIFQTENEYLFRNFIERNNEERKKYEKGDINNDIHKLMGNSIYGKLAQGLNPTPIKNFKTGIKEVKPPSKISNPLLAAYITALIRWLIYAAAEFIFKLKKPNLIPVNEITDGILLGQPSKTITKEIINSFNNIPLCQKIREILGLETIWELKHFNPNPHISIKTRIDFPQTNEQIIPYIRKHLKELKIAWPSAFDKHYEPVEGLTILNDILFNEPNRQISRTRLKGYKEVIRNGEFVQQIIVNSTINWNIQKTRKPIELIDNQYCQGVVLTYFQKRDALIIHNDYMERRKNQFIFHQIKNIKKLIALRNKEKESNSQLSKWNKIMNDVIHHFKNELRQNLTYSMLTETLKKLFPKYTFNRLKKSLKKPFYDRGDPELKIKWKWTKLIKRKVANKSDQKKTKK